MVFPSHYFPSIQGHEDHVGSPTAIGCQHQALGSEETGLRHQGRWKLVQDFNLQILTAIGNWLADPSLV